MDNIEYLTHASRTLGLVSTVLDQIDWDWLAREIERAETLGPIVEPTAFQEAVSSGVLASNKKLVHATRDYLKTLHKIAEEQGTGTG